MRIWKKILAIGTAIAGVIVSLYLYMIGKKHGKEAGKKEVRKEHEKIIEKVQERDKAKQTVNQENVVDRLNSRFNDNPK